MIRLNGVEREDLGELVQREVQLVSNGKSRDRVCHWLGINPSSFDNYINGEGTGRLLSVVRLLNRLGFDVLLRRRVG